MNLPKSFIITTSTRGASRKQIWKPEQPLTIGFPMQWLMESTSEGVRITYLGGKSGELSKKRVQEISFSELKKNPLIRLRPDAPSGRGARSAAQNPQDSQIDLQIELATSAAPVFEQASSHSDGERHLGIYRTLGNWVVEAHRMEKEFTALAGSTRVFSLKRGSDNQNEIQILSHASGLALVRPDGSRGDLKETPKLSAIEIAGSAVVYRNPSGGLITWRFGWILANPAATKVSRLPTLDLGADSEAPTFHKQLRNVAIALVALLALSLVWPKPQHDELIPPQLAKIILTPPMHAAAEVARGSTVNTPAQKKVQQTAVVQAFRAKALQSAVSKLMKGGMTRLLAQSDFIAGHRQNAELGKILDTQSKDLRDLSPRIGGLATRNLAVAALGGDGVGDKTGKHLGYGKGERASVSGQGKAFVSMDIADSQVDDGLTKDQVGEVIHQHLSEVRYCYESAMVRMPNIEGKLLVDFTIGGNGIVKMADAKESTLPDPRLDDCILRRLASWKFPNPRGGVDVAVTYPFIFKTLGR